MNIQSYDFNLKGPGSSMLIDSDAQVIDFVDCSDPTAAIKVIPDLQQGGMAIRLGQGFDAGSKVKSWLIVNASNGPISGTIVLSDAGFRNFRMFGTVSVIDDSINRSFAGSSYIGYGYMPPTTDLFPYVQLWNPVGSGKTVVLETSTIEAGFIGQMVFGGSVAPIGATQETTVSAKLLGGALGVAQIRKMAGPRPTQGVFGVVSMSDNTNVNLPFRDPIVLPPGSGFFAAGNGGASANMAAMFEWYEK